MVIPKIFFFFHFYDFSSVVFAPFTTQATGKLGKMDIFHRKSQPQPQLFSSASILAKGLAIKTSQINEWRRRSFFFVFVSSSRQKNFVFCCWLSATILYYALPASPSRPTGKTYQQRLPGQFCEWNFIVFVYSFLFQNMLKI